MKKRNVVILGSTGSIGVNALDVVRQHPQSFRVLGLAANRNVAKLISQIKEFKPKTVALDHTPSAEKLKQAIRSWKIKPIVLNHEVGLDQLASNKEADLVLCGMVGGRGLSPLISAIKAGKMVGLANKEALISAGPLIRSLAIKHKASIIPVDSEHSAMFQCIQGHPNHKINRIILTASGGPFYKFDGELKNITVDQALNHPTWKMGNKITVDSATLMNKGLEAIEAHYLFGVSIDQIKIVIHPQSIIHSMVEFDDGASLAQLSHPDMRIPIQYAMTYPERIHTSVKKLDLEDVGQLTFAKPDFSRFPCLKLALDAGRKGGTAPVALSASNEVAVHAFIAGRIRFTEIPNVVNHALVRHTFKSKPTMSDVFETDTWARSEAENLIKEKSIQ